MLEIKSVESSGKSRTRKDKKSRRVTISHKQKRIHRANCHTYKKYCTEKVHYCSACQFTTTRPNILKHHMISKHSNLNPRSCPYCNYCTFRVRDLKNHIQVFCTKNRNLRYCSSCDYSSNFSRDMRNHIKKHLKNSDIKKIYACPFCIFRTANGRYINQHIKRRHSDKKSPIPFLPSNLIERPTKLNMNIVDEQNQLETKIRSDSKYIPSDCMPKLKKFTDIKKNMETLDSPPTNEYSIFGTINVSEVIERDHLKSYSCHFCEFRSSRACILKDHVSSKHAKSKTYSCKVCSYYSADVSILIDHMATEHRSGKLYNCSDSTYGSHSFEDLKRHVFFRHDVEKSDLSFVIKTEKEIEEKKNFYAPEIKQIKQEIKEELNWEFTDKYIHTGIKIEELDIQPEALELRVVGNEGRTVNYICHHCQWNWPCFNLLKACVRKCFALTQTKSVLYTCCHCHRSWASPEQHRVCVEKCFSHIINKINESVVIKEEVNPDITINDENALAEVDQPRDLEPEESVLFDNEKETDLEEHDWNTDKTDALPIKISSVKTLRKYDNNCLVCSYSTDRPSRLKIHIMAKHSHMNPYFCNDCFFCTFKESDLKDHIKKHRFGKHFIPSRKRLHNNKKTKKITNRPYTRSSKRRDNSIKPTIIENAFSYNRDLKALKCCPCCEFNAADNNTIQKHVMAVHKHEKPFCCPHCIYGTNQRRSLDLHVMEEHPNIW